MRTLVLTGGLITLGILSAFIALRMPEPTFAADKEGVMASTEIAPLSPEEERIILRKGTEPAFSGKFYNYKEKGFYSCRKCGQELFDSASKFDSKSGWPSFDDTLAGAVKEIADKDGNRVEIVCSR
ncbi:MAG: peptide-methionine (R)-S-oxide reductase, partial [Planctomycetes bacterium]|nr:peptide-methionine (R)-S-oxide reductase [Planctomycetota bacterium]